MVVLYGLLVLARALECVSQIVMKSPRARVISQRSLQRRDRLCLPSEVKERQSFVARSARVLRD